MSKQIKIALSITLAFIIISIGTTYMLINKNKSKAYENNENVGSGNIQESIDNNSGNQVENEEDTSGNKNELENSGDIANNNIDNSQKGIDLCGFYNENDLLIEEIPLYGVGYDVKVPQIKGLKDKNIEEKINQDMQNICQEYIQQALEEKGENSQIKSNKATVEANFSNVVSLHFDIYKITYGEQYAEGMKTFYFNYNLVTGEKIEFEDIFVEEADILEVVRDAFRTTIQEDDYYENEQMAPIIGEYIALYDENELYKAVKGFMEEEEKVFYFGSTFLYFKFGKISRYVKLKKIADKVSIYDKYVTEESIFERDDIGRKNIINIATNSYDNFDIVDYGYIGDNLWYDITAYSYVNMDDEKVEEKKRVEDYIQKRINVAYEKLEEHKETVKSNQDTFYIFFVSFNLSASYEWDYDDNGEGVKKYSGIARSTFEIETYEMPIEMFNNKYKIELMNAYRYLYYGYTGMSISDIIYDEMFEDNAICKIYREEIEYNYLTNEEKVEIIEMPE